MVTYDPTNTDPHQQLVQIGSGTLDFKLAGNDITGNLTNLTIYADGFHFDSVTVKDTTTITLGSVLSLTNPSATLTDFGVTFSNGTPTIQAGSLTISEDSVALTIGPVNATAANLSITVDLNPATVGHVTITAGELDFNFSTYVTIKATDVSIDTNPDPDAAYLSVGSATVTVSLGNAVTLGGTASNFSVINSNGSPHFYEGIVGDPTANFGISITATPGQLQLPSWLGFQIQKLEISWDDFANHPDQFQLVLSASINSIQGLPGGVTVSGEITDAVIDFGKLQALQFPITSIGSVGGSVSGTLFGLEVNAGFVLGIVSFNAENDIVSGSGNSTKVTHLTTNTQTGVVTETTVTTNPDTNIVNSIMYVGVEGGATIPGVGGIQVYIGFSSLGPLTFYVSAQVPIILDPDTGIAIGGLRGGVIFDYTIPTPNTPQDLAGIHLSPADLKIDEWQQQLRDQTVTQYTASGGGTNLTAAYSQPFVIEAGVTLYDAYLTQDAFTISGDIAIQIDPSNLNNAKIFVTGTATFGGSLSFNAYLYLNINVSGSASTATVMFLAEAPADTPVESFGGSLQFGFLDGGGNPITPTNPTTTFSEWIALGTTYNSAGTASINSLPAGTYVWTPGKDVNGVLTDISLTVDGQTYLASSAVNGQVAITTTSASAVTLTGTANAKITGTLGSVLSSGSPLPSGAYYTLTTFNAPPPIQGFYISLHGFLEYQVPGESVVNVTISGAVTLTVNLAAKQVKLDLWGDLTVGFLGEIAQAQGEFVVDFSGSTPAFYGALLVNSGSGLAKLQSFGLTLSGSLEFQINTTGHDVQVNLPNAPPTSAPPTTGTVAPLASNLITISGTVIFDLTATATVSYSIGTTTLFSMQGFFDIQLINTNGTVSGLTLEMFASISSLTIGSDGSGGSLINFSGFGLFVINSQGFAAEIALNLSTTNIPDFSLNGNFTLVINTTSQDVTYTIPTQTTLTIPNGGVGVKIYDWTNGNLLGTATTLVIPAGPPQGSPTLTGNTASYGVTGASGPYVVIAGHAALTVLSSLTLTGTLRFELSSSSTNGLVISLVVNATADLSGVSSGPGGSSQGAGLVVTGAIQINSGGPNQGIVALLSVGGGANTTTDYGSGVKLTANFQVGINTTSTGVNSIGGVLLKDSLGNTITIDAATAEIIGTGTLELSIGGTGFMITGSIFASGSGTTGVTISVNGTLTATVNNATLLTMSAAGTLTVTNGGAVYGALELTTSGSNPLSGSGFNFSGQFDLELNTDTANAYNVTLNSHPISLDVGPYVKVHAQGNLTFGTTNNDGSLNTGFQFTNADLYLQIGSGGLAVSTSANLNVAANNQSLFSMTGSAAMLISSKGFAASLTLTMSFNDPSSAKLYAFDGTFSLQVNTTGTSVTIGSVTIDAGPNKSTTGSPYFQIYISGTLAVGSTNTNTSASGYTGLYLHGDFFLTVGSSGLAITASAQMNLSVGGANIFSLDAKGALLINSSGIAAKITLTLGGNSTVSSSNSLFSYNATFLFEINTTGAPVTTINNQTVNIPGGPVFVEIAASGSLTLGGFLTLNGSFDFKLNGTSITIAINATLTVFGVTFTAVVDAGLYSDGIALNINLMVGSNSNPTVTIIPGVLSLTGSFNLQINTAGSDKNFPGGVTITKNTTFDVKVNASFNLFGFSLATAAFEFKHIGGVFSATGQVDFDFFGFATLKVHFYFDSGGNYWFYGNIYVQLGSDSFNIHGSLTVEFASNSVVNDSHNLTDGLYGAPPVTINHNFYLRVEGGVTAFSYDFAKIGASVSINGSDVSISVYVSVDLGLFSVGGTVTIDLGQIGPPPPAAPAPPTLGTLNNGVLTLNIGPNAGDRSYNGSAIPASANESYRILLAADSPSSGPQNIWVISSVYSGLAEYANTQTAITGTPPAGAVEYVGVSSIVANTGSSNTNITIDSNVKAQVTFTAGSGNNNFILGGWKAGNNNTITGTTGNDSVYAGAGPLTINASSGKNHFIMGSGLATIFGSSGTDTVIGGSGGVIFHAGSGTSVFIGGNANNTIYDPGTVSIVEGYSSQIANYDSNTKITTYSLVSYDYSYYNLSGSTLKYGSSASSYYTDTLVGTFSNVTLTGLSSGATTFAVSNYSGNVTINANGNSNVTTTIETDNGNLSLTGSAVTQSNGLTGTITLQSAVTTTDSATGVSTTTTGVYSGSLNLLGGAGDNTFIVNSWSGSGLALNGGDGSDIYKINFQNSGSFTANVNDSGVVGTDALITNGTPGNDIINISSNAVSLGSQVVNYTGIENLTVNTGTGNDTVNVNSTSTNTVINGGSGNDTFNVPGIGYLTTINLGSGTNTVNVGTNAPTESGGTLNNIQALLTVNGGNGGTNTLYLDDSADNSAATATLTASSLTGVFGPGGSLNYSGIRTFNLYLGNGNHTMNVQGMNGTVNITLGNGTNLINIGSNAGPIVTDPNTGNATNTGSILDQIVGLLNFTGTGSNSVNVDDSGGNKPVDGALKPTSIQFLNLVTINLPTVVAINISLSQADDLFVVADTFISSSVTPVVVLDGNGGDDSFLIFDTHAVMTMNGGDGEDTFYNFGNSAVLYLNGNDGDDTFYVYASVSASDTNVGPGGADSNGNHIYSYRVNAPVYINGGSGNDKLFIYATILDDVITINGTAVTGAGIDVNFTQIEQLTVAGLGGNDTFYIESITVPTTIIGDGVRVLPAVNDILTALGLTLPNLDGNAPPPTSFNDTFYVAWQGKAFIPGSLSVIQAPLTIYGDNGPNLDGSTTNIPNSNDTIYVDDSAATANTTYTLTASTFVSNSMGLGGIINYEHTTENLNIKCGAGDDTIIINGNYTGSQTTIYGGPGNDQFVVNDDPLQAPLALVGDSNTFTGDTLTIYGAPEGNNFIVTGFTVDGAGATISYATIEVLTINAVGASSFTVNGDSIPTYLNGGTGSDTFTVNSSSVPLFLDGAAGNDIFTINGNSGSLVATGDAGNDTFTVNGNSGGLSLSGGDDNDSFTVNALSAPATLNGDAGDDSFTVNAPVAASPTIIGGGGAGDTLTVNGTVGNEFWVITNNAVAGVGAQVNYNDLDALIVKGISGNDTFNVRSTSADTTIYTGTGLNTINVGSTSPVAGGIVDGVQGALTIVGNGNDVLNIDDTGSTIGKAGTLTGTTLNGLAMGAGGITFNGISVLNISLGSGDDTLTIVNTPSVPTTINGNNGNDTFNVQGTTGITNLNGGAGNDTFNLGSLSPATGGTVNAILGQLNINGGTDVAPALSLGGRGDVVNVDDSGDTMANTGLLTSTKLTGLGLGLEVNYIGVESLNINLGLGNDTFNIHSTNSTTTTTVNTGAGTNTVNVGSTAPAAAGTVNTILGALVVVGDGNDTLNVNDSGDTTANSGTLTPTTITGLGLGAGGITYTGLAVLNILLGAGGDTFAINDITDSTVTTVNGGAGKDSAALNFSGDFAAQNLTLLNVESATLNVGGDFTGRLNDDGDITVAQISGSFTSSGILNAGSIDTMTILGDFAGLLNVSGLLDTLAVGGGSPGKIIAGSINLISVQAGYGNKVLQVIEGGVERQIQAVPVAGGTLADTIRFTFVYDSIATGNPQLAIRITNSGAVTLHSFDLALVCFSSSAKFNLALVSANGLTGLSNVAVSGDIFARLTIPELSFLVLPTGSRGGVNLPLDNITGVEVSGILTMGTINVAGIEGLAFGILKAANGAVVNLSGDISSTKLLNILGSKATILAATDVFRVPFNETHTVRLYAQTNTNSNLEYVLTLTDQKADHAPVTAYVQVQPATSTSNAVVQSINLIGDGGSLDCVYAVNSITSTGPLGNVTVRGSAGLGNITAPSIFGNINILNGGITGTIQTTGIRIDPVTGVETAVNADLGQVVYKNGKAVGVSSIFAKFDISGQIISRGNLISSIKTSGKLTGVVAAQGDIGAILRNSGGSAVTTKSGQITRFGGVTVGGNDSGQIIALGNIFASVTINGSLTGRIAAKGQAVLGLTSARFGILGDVKIKSAFAASAAVVSGGLIGDAVNKTSLSCGSASGLLAANGAIRLGNSVKISPANVFQNAQANANGAVINAIFTDGSLPLQIVSGTAGLAELALIEADVNSIQITGGNLTGTTP